MLYIFVTVANGVLGVLMLDGSGHLANVSHLEYCTLLWGKEGHGPLGESLEEAMKILRGLENLCYGGFSLKREALGGSKSTFQCLKGPLRKIEKIFDKGTG